MQLNIINSTADKGRVFALIVSSALTSTYKKPLNIESINEKLKKGSYKQLPERLLNSGHTTVFEHAVFTLSIKDVSRLLTWILHYNPFYNSTQQSQRYVVLSEPRFYNPNNNQEFEKLVLRAFDGYKLLQQSLENIVFEAYKERFPYRHESDQLLKKHVKKKSGEIARYVLPLATYTNLTHTVNLLTMFRYIQYFKNIEVIIEDEVFKNVHGSIYLNLNSELTEAKEFSKALKQVLIDYDPMLESLISKIENTDIENANSNYFELIGYKKSMDWDAYVDSKTIPCAKLTEFTPRQEETILEQMPSDWEYRMYRMLSSPINAYLMSDIKFLLQQVYYVFKEKISHSAESQNQRHRTMNHGKPLLSLHREWYIPMIIKQDNEILDLYNNIMNDLWDGIMRFLYRGDLESAVYLLPNVSIVRKTKAVNYPSLLYFSLLRLCLRTQEEIWRLALKQTEEVMNVHPMLGSLLAPKCVLRFKSKTRPYCNEGLEYCGIDVWNSDFDELSTLDRII